MNTRRKNNIVIAMMLIAAMLHATAAFSQDSVVVHTWHIVSKTSREFAITKHPVAYADSIMISQVFKMGKNYRSLVSAYRDYQTTNLYIIVANPPVLTDEQKRKAFILY